MKLKLKEGEQVARWANQPIISFQHGYLWIGNDAENDMFCFATLDKPKALLKLAEAIQKEYDKKK